MIYRIRKEGDGVAEYVGGPCDTWAKAWVLTSTRSSEGYHPAIGMDRQGWYYLVLRGVTAEFKEENHPGPFTTYEEALATYHLMFP